MAAKKSTDIEIRLRVEEVYTLLLGGARRKEILQYAAKWELSDRQVDYYISEAQDLIQAQVDKRTDYEFAKAIIRLEGIYTKTLKVQDYKTALAAVKELQTLFGLYPASKVENSGEMLIRVVRGISERSNNQAD